MTRPEIQSYSGPARCPGSLMAWIPAKTKLRPVIPQSPALWLLLSLAGVSLVPYLATISLQSLLGK